MRKKLRLLIPLLALLVLLSGCARAVGGSYTLTYGTAEGLRFSPGSLGIHISLELGEDGVGTANYNGTEMEVTWSDQGGSILLEGKNGQLSFVKDGKDLILHEDGISLYLTPVEEED